MGDAPVAELWQISKDRFHIVVDVSTGRALIASTITPIPRMLLQNLLNSPCETVEHLVLIKTAWGEERASSVTPNRLEKMVEHLRRPLGETGERPRFIFNDPKKGYKLVGDLREANLEVSEFHSMFSAIIENTKTPAKLEQLAAETETPDASDADPDPLASALIEVAQKLNPDALPEPEASLGFKVNSLIVGVLEQEIRDILLTLNGNRDFRAQARARLGNLCDALEGLMRSAKGPH
jgi:DNA-binding winged helix-turn-helix (wHTH) protein